MLEQLHVSKAFYLLFVVERLTELREIFFSQQTCGHGRWTHGVRWHGDWFFRN